MGRDELADHLADIRGRLDHPPGVRLGVLRLPILDEILAELESTPGGVARTRSSDVVVELERLADLLAHEMLGIAPEAVGRRMRIIELLRESDGGRAPARAADDQDPFGLELRAMLASDVDLRGSLGLLYGLIARATSVSPSAGWLRDAKALSSGAEGPRLTAATGRILASLLRAPVSSRVDLLIGGVRPINQRIARGLLWFASVALDAPAELLGTIGVRMGTSGRNDAVVRDVALANTSAALLSVTSDPAAPTALASMRSRLTNRAVLKHVDRALKVVADRSGITVEELVDLALPTFGLDESGRLDVDIGAASARLAISHDGDVEVRWRRSDGVETGTVPVALADEEPAAIADVLRRADAVRAALAEELGRLEDGLGSQRARPAPVWRRRYIEHPVAGPIARQLVWVVDQPAGPSLAVLPFLGGLVGMDERPIPPLVDGVTVRLWHPAEAGAAATAAWRATLASLGVRQPFAQVWREVFQRDPASRASLADLRFAGRIVGHAQMRALLRSRGWAVPALGAWDQGAEATGWRPFDDGLRAEIRYLATSQVPTGKRVEWASIVAVRFVRTETLATTSSDDPRNVPLGDVPARCFSEAIRDVSLAVVVAEIPGAS